MVGLLDKFRVTVNETLRPNRFSCRVFFPPQIANTLDMSEACEIAVREAELPGRNVGVIDVPKRGNPHAIPGNVQKFADITLTFLNINGNGLREAFERWSTYMASEIAGTVANDASVYGTIQIEQLNGVDAVVKTYELLYVFPNSIGNIALSEENGDQIETYTISFTYSAFVTNLL